MAEVEGFFWLLTQQQEAAAVAKSRRREARSDAAPPRTEQPAQPAAAQGSSDGAKPSTGVTEIAADTPAAALLLALAHGAPDVAVSLQEQDFAEHMADSAALREAASQALLAALLLPPGSSQAAESPGCESTKAAAAAAAAACGLPALVSRLLELGADPSFARQADGLCPLVAALSGGHLEAAKQLLDAGAQTEPPPWSAGAADVSTAAAGGVPAATDGAAAGGSRTPKRKRLEAGAGAGSTPANGGAAAAAAAAAAQPTPLVLAVIAGSQELAQRLLSSGADPNRQCTVQLTAGQPPVALTPLVAAVQMGSTSLVDCLLAAGADIHQKCVSPGSGGADWTSALSAAVLGGSEGMVAHLVAAGACAPRGTQAKPAGGHAGGGHIGQDHPALRAVVLAAQRGRLAAVELMYPLLAAGLQGGSAAMLGVLRRRTILHPLAAAAERGHLAVVNRLLQLGAPADHDRSVWAGVAQYTPLMLAAAGGHLAVVDRLLRAGASPAKANAREEVPAMLALRHGHLAVLRLLLERGGEVLPPPLAPGEPGQEQQGQGWGQGSKRVPAAAAGVPQVAPGSPCLQLANASRAWQLGFSSGLLHRGKPTSLAALEEERQRYRLLLLALLGAHAGTGRGAGSAGASGPGGGSSPSSDGTNGAAADAILQLRQLATPASLAHAAAGSEALLDVLLAAGLSVGSVDPADGSFPLLAAAHHGWQAMARLLSRGADPNQADPRGTTVLMLMAARPAMLETAQHLLRWHAEQAAAAAGSGREAATGANGTPATPAAAQVQPCTAAKQPPPAHDPQQPPQQHSPQQRQQPVKCPQQHQPLLDLGKLDAEGRDAVGVALAAKNRRFAEELLAHLAVASAPPALRSDAAARAAAVATKAYDLLAERQAKRLADINALHGGQHLLLAQAVSASRKQLRQLLALPGLDLNARDPATGRTPLMLLAEGRRTLLVGDLMAYAAAGRVDLEARDAAGATAALLAARAGDGVALRALLDAGADPDCADNAGGTPLMALARQNQHKLMSDLLHRGKASLDRQDAAGRSALHLAAAAGHFGACRVLSSHGADLGLRTAEGKSALELAQEAGHAAVLPLLRPAQAGRQAATGRAP
ncbi:hypothetical protein ABPG75_007879 [Micractinium tetrahymenae]